MLTNRQMVGLAILAAVGMAFAFFGASIISITDIINGWISPFSPHEVQRLSLTDEKLSPGVEDVILDVLFILGGMYLINSVLVLALVAALVCPDSSAPYWGLGVAMLLLLTFGGGQLFGTLPSDFYGENTPIGVPTILGFVGIAGVMLAWRRRA
jgi:hypothetical protein